MTFPELLQELLSIKILFSCPLVMLNPLIWNVIVRLEYKKRIVSRLCGGPRKGVIVLAGLIMLCNLIRTLYFRSLAESSTRLSVLENSTVYGVGYVIVGVGIILVVCSAWSLGFYNTFLGDYFRILMGARVTAFPFNILSDPMYWGAFLVYLGEAIQYASTVAFVLSLCIGFSYFLAAKFEAPFTAMIYNQAKKS